MIRTLMATLLAASLTGVAAAAANSEDTADQPAAGTATTKVEDRGWFSRVNPFSPLINPEAMTKKTDPVVPPEGTSPGAAPDGTVAAEGSQTPKDEAEGEAQPTVPVLNGILFSDRLVIAIVSDAIAKTGDLLDGYRITSITRDTVVAEKEGQPYIMTTRRPMAQLNAPPQAAGKGATRATAPGPDRETLLSPLLKTADKTDAGPHAPAKGASEPTQPTPQGAERTP